MSSSDQKNIKKFIGRITLFFLPIAILAYFLDTPISKIIKKSNGEIQDWEALLNGKVNSDIVIYGASRAWVTIDPLMIGDSLHTTAYNLGVDGHNFMMEHLRHYYLLKYNKKPKAIIVALDFSILSKRPDLYNLEQFSPYILKDDEIKKITSQYIGFNWADYNLPLVRFYGSGYRIYTQLRIPALDLRIRGYQPQDRPWQKTVNYKFKIDFDPPTLKLFDDFLKECKQLGIKIIFVYPPEYYWGQKTVINRNELFSYFLNYSKMYNVPFFDYSKDSLSYNKKYFYNTEHLNSIGSKLFTRELIDTLKKTHLLQP